MMFKNIAAGSELTLAEDIECFWLSGPSEASASTAAMESQQLEAALNLQTSIDPAPARQSLSRAPDSATRGRPCLYIHVSLRH